MSRVVVCDRVWRAQAELLSIAGHTVFFEVIGSLARGKAFGLMHVRAVGRRARARPELGPSCADAALMSVRALMLPGPAQAVLRTRKNGTRLGYTLNVERCTSHHLPLRCCRFWGASSSLPVRCSLASQTSCTSAAAPSPLG